MHAHKQSLLQIEESLSESRGLLEKVVKQVKELADRISSLEIQIQVQNVKSHSQSESSTAITESASSSFLRMGPAETEMELVPSTVGTLPDVTAVSHSELSPKDMPEQQYGYTSRGSSSGYSSRSSSPFKSEITAISRSQPSLYTTEQQRKQHYSDSKITKYWRSEIRGKQQLVRPKLLSEQITVSIYTLNYF